MLPVTHGVHYTKVHILLYTLALIAITLLPFATGMLNWLYLLGAVVLGLGFLYWSLVLLLTDRPSAGMDTFKYSIVYLMVLFVIMLVDHYALPLPPPV
jgi:protoheme IX farnesyltransferase